MGTSSVLPQSYLRSAALAPPRPTHRPDRGYGRHWFYCPMCGQWRWVSWQRRRKVCDLLCRSRLNAARGNERRGKCARPGCQAWRRSGRKSCSRTCHRWLLRRHRIGRPLSTKPRAFDCVVCNRHCERAYPCEVPPTKTCSRRCLAVVTRTRWLQRRLRQLFKLAQKAHYPSRTMIVMAFELGLRVNRRLSQRQSEHRRTIVRAARKVMTK